MKKPAYTPEYCEKQYNVRAAIPEHPKIFARWKDESIEARRTLPWKPSFGRYGPPMPGSIGTASDTTPPATGFT